MQDDAPSAGNGGGIGHQLGLPSGPPQRLQHGTQVAEPEIDDRNVHSTPLVLGTVPASRASSATAWRSARANDLNTASAP